jgi:hypothetical protein
VASASQRPSCRSRTSLVGYGQKAWSSPRRRQKERHGADRQIGARAHSGRGATRARASRRSRSPHRASSAALRPRCERTRDLYSRPGAPRAHSRGVHGGATETRDIPAPALPATRGIAVRLLDSVDDGAFDANNTVIAVKHPRDGRPSTPRGAGSSRPRNTTSGPYAGPSSTAIASTSAVANGSSCAV